MSAKLHIGYMKKTCICLTVAEMKYNHVLYMCNTLVIHDTITLAIIHKITHAIDRLYYCHFFMQQSFISI